MRNAESRRSNRRRKKVVHDIDYDIPSPCVMICRLDSDQVCIGCHRTIDEIRNWAIMNKSEKLTTLAAIDTRKQQQHS